MMKLIAKKMIAGDGCVTMKEQDEPLYNSIILSDKYGHEVFVRKTTNSKDAISFFEKMVEGESLL